VTARRVFALIAGLVLVAELAASASAAAAQQVGPPGRAISWLNVGDSYGAGEGATQATGHCQRSPNAAGPKAGTILRQERGWQIAPDVFSACTGHLAADLFSSRQHLLGAGYRVYGSELGPIPEGAELGNDRSLYQWALAQGAKPPGGYDVITVSLGGNDVGFADVVVGCMDLVRRLTGGVNRTLPSVTGTEWEAFARQAAVDHADAEGCGLVSGELERRADAQVDPNDGEEPGFGAGAQGTVSGEPLRSLQQLYTSLADDLLSPEGVLVVMGYPRLVTPSSTWGRWRGGQCNFLTARDADLLGDAAVHYDDALRNAIEGMDERFEYVSRLEVFDDGESYHSLCGRGVEWINTPLLFLRDGTLRRQRGFHPNDLGYLATAEAVAGVVESRLGVVPTPPDTTPAPPVTPPPTVRSSEQHYDIGERFSARCTVAWPTAPSRGVDNIQMRTFCPSVPDQFLFVDVVYDDPDLPVTPSRSTMQVDGEIVDIARSEFGFTVLVVYATEIELT
jgi:lysophospholipase L1-like esterase